MFTIFLTNFGYFVDHSYTRFDEALKKAKSIGFETSIYHGNKDAKELVASWSPIGDTRYHNGFMVPL